MPRFDGYTATLVGTRPEDLVNQVLWTLPDQVKRSRGFHRFEHRAAVVDDAGDEVGAVMWGGKTHGGRVMFEVKGERSPGAVDRFRQLVGPHRCTRVDSCQDFDEPGAWSRLLRHVSRVKRDFRLRGERRGDWDYPEDGRTQYLGAPTSAVRARLYEKGKQPEYVHLKRFDLVRLEIQARPVKAAKTVYSELSPLEVWGASPFTRELAARVLKAHLDEQPAGTVWKQSERDRALWFMCQQYGRHLVGSFEDQGGWDVVGLTIGDIIKKQIEDKRGGQS